MRSRATAASMSFMLNTVHPINVHNSKDTAPYYSCAVD